MLTLQNVQTPAFQTASGYCTTSQDFLDMTNQVIPRLLQRGDWPGTLMPVRVSVRNGQVTWFRYVGQVRSMHSCRGNIPVHPVWYEFLEWRGSRHPHEWEGMRERERHMTEQYHAPTYNDIYGLNCTVRLYVDAQEDVGATVQIFGTDNNNQPLRTNNGDGTWSDGVTITSQMPFGSTSTFVSRIDRVVCSKTQSTKRLYAYDSVQNVLYDLAVYEPSETVPSYLRYQLDGGRPGPTCCETVIALVKLKFLPVSAPTDGLIFLEGAQGALLHGFRAVKREEAGDYQGAGLAWKAAVEELNRGIEDQDPDGPVAVNNIFGAGRAFSNHLF